MTHELKIKEKFADAVYSGRKTFEFRFDDRGYWVDDEIVFDVRDEVNNKIQHPLNGERYRITYVLSETIFDKIPKGWVVLGIKRIEAASTNEEFCAEFNERMQKKCSYGIEALVDINDKTIVNIYIFNKLWTRLVEPRLYERQTLNLLDLLVVDTRYLAQQFAPQAGKITAEDFCEKLIRMVEKSEM